ncbi:MAG: hypothetical protein PHC51_13200 [bacterium]|nr:hypothetical protein [bacterium]
MGNHDLLEKVLASTMDENLKNDLLRYLFKKAGRRESNGVLRLNYCPKKLDYDEIYERMKAVGGGTGVSVAKLLGITTQGMNNQVARGKINGNTLINFCLKTKVSLDWLIGACDGSSTDYLEEEIPSITDSETIIDQPLQQYLSLVEVYDQHSGNVELKWCLTKTHLCLDDDNHPIPGDFGALLSLIIRYKDQSGTPERVKTGGKRHYQVRRVLAYVLGESKIVRYIDARAKNLTATHTSGHLDRPGKTEFRLHSAMDECLNVLTTLACQNGLSIVKPEFGTIAWDFLIGTGSMSPRDWVLSKLKESQAANEFDLVTTETSMVGWDFHAEPIMHTDSIAYAI